MRNVGTMRRRMLSRERATPPAILFHSTSHNAADAITRDGLKPISRQYVHLSVDRAAALEVGRRKSQVPVLFEIEARAAHDSGVAFYTGNEKVWFADFVPACSLRVVT